jgi:hypothetical protein
MKPCLCRERQVTGQQRTWGLILNKISLTGGSRPTLAIRQMGTYMQIIWYCN